MKNHIPELKYETIVQESVVKRLAQPKGLEPLYYDEKAFNNTDIGRRRRELASLYEVYHDAPMHQNVLKYWAGKGLKKELYGDEEEWAPHAYSVFTPLDMDPDKKYALIYFCHGGGQPIGWAETYGFNTLAAVEKYIVVYAQNGGRSNDEIDTEFGRVMGELRENGYPIDWERVYVVGFSSGSSASVCAAVTYPDMVAAIGCLPDRIPFSGLPFFEGPETYASTKGYRIPGIFMGGTADKGNFPAPWINDYFGNELPVGTLENTTENFNIWREKMAQVKNYEPLDLEKARETLKTSDDYILKEFGMTFDQTFTFRAQGTNWLGGDFYGIDNAPVMRYVRAEGVPHMVWESEANIAWDYLKHFRRDQATGESIYDPVVCWGER